MTATSEFIDIIGANFGRAPLAKGTCRAVYVTGSGGIEETAAQITALRNAGMGAITIDQTPGLAVFAAGKADCADVEPYAGTDSAAHTAVAERQARGEESTLYVSLANLGALDADIADHTGVFYWVADWSWSANQASQLLAAHPTWHAIQFGDPQSNPRTLVPGTAVDLAQAQCDIDMGDTAWLNGFLPGTPPPPPPPPTAPPWPLQSADYLGQPSTDVHCHSGYTNSVDNHIVMTWQQRMRDRGWHVAGKPLVADGFYGPNTHQVCVEFQTEKHLTVSGRVGPNTWSAAWELPIT